MVCLPEEGRGPLKPFSLLTLPSGLRFLHSCWVRLGTAQSQYHWVCQMYNSNHAQLQTCDSNKCGTRLHHLCVEEILMFSTFSIAKCSPHLEEHSFSTRSWNLIVLRQWTDWSNASTDTVQMQRVVNREVLADLKHEEFWKAGTLSFVGCGLRKSIPKTSTSQR